MKKRVFVSVPMSGKDDAIIERNIQVTIARYLKLTKQSFKNVEFYDNFHACQKLTWDHKTYKVPGLSYLGFAISNLGDCDEAIFGQGWKSARGCRIEERVCKEYGIPTRKFGRIYKIKKED